MDDVTKLRDGHSERAARYHQVVGLYDIQTRFCHEFSALAPDDGDKRVVIIGRSPRVDICIADPQVSRVHCRIFVYRDPLRYVLEDTDSTNGLFINHIKVSRVVLEPRMWIFLGARELIALGEDREIPITACSETSFLVLAARYYGSDEKASVRVHRSATTIRRARHRRVGRRHRVQTEESTPMNQ